MSRKTARRFWPMCLAFLMHYAFLPTLRGEEPAGIAVLPESPGEDVMSTDRGYFNIPVPTLGGRQFWGDVLFYQGWRIQENVFTKHYRLIDAGDVRRAWGTREACETALAEFKKSEQLPPMQGEVVIYLHGIIRSSKSISSLITSLEESNYTVVGFDYPSTQVTMIDSAAYLKQVIDSLEGVEKIHFVCHSMGGLIVRTYLQQYEPDPRIGRMVMLGVPNLGAKMADIMKDNILYQFIYGPAGQELVENPEGYIAKLPTPQFEFAVIAGARGTNDGWNPLIPGDDDGTVSVDATRLPGAVDFMTVPAIHSFMMSNEQAQAATLNFLKHGCLRESGERSPIIRKENAVKSGE